MRSHLDADRSRRDGRRVVVVGVVPRVQSRYEPGGITAGVGVMGADEGATRGPLIDWFHWPTSPGAAGSCRGGVSPAAEPVAPGSTTSAMTMSTRRIPTRWATACRT